MIKRNNLVYNVHSVNEYVGDKNINQPIQVVVKDVTLINDYNLKIIYNNGATKNIELVNNSIKKFEYVSEGNKIIIETNNNDNFEIEIPMVISHKDLTNKNQEADNQHIDTTITKETLVNDDKVAILDSVTGKIVLTDKSNVGIDTFSDVTHEELLNIINNNELIPNSSYRITNYTTTTVQADTTSAGHDFDIIVTALSTNELSENASCVRKVGDTYFENANLEAWEIKYCIHNDTTRFAWADSINGKGVIYYMKDEWGNECPYDFKNIQFKKSDVFLYTFGGATDDSLAGGCHHNKIMDYTSSSVLILNFNTFGNNCQSNTFGNDCYSNTFGTDYKYNTFDNSCYSNTFGNNCQSNTFGYGCYSNTFGNYCISNTFGTNCKSNTFGSECRSNTFGNGCIFNTFGDNCYSNLFGNSCYSNLFGNICYFNSFGDNCYSNRFGYGCYSNTFGSECRSNTFGDNCQFNTFANSCWSNTFGNNCLSNTFGNSCSSNNFYTETSGNTKKNYIQFIVLEDGCSYNNFYSSITTSSSSYLQRIRIKGLKNTTATDTQITLPATNTNYEWLVCYTSSGVLKQ